MPFVKMNQSAYSLTLGGSSHPGYLKIVNGKFEMVSGSDPSNYDLKVTGTKIELANGSTVIDGANNKITVNGIVIDGNANKITIGDSTLILDAANKRIVVHDGTTNRVVIGNLT